MPDMDQGIKRLIQTHPADILALAVPGTEYLGTLPVDVASEPRLVLDTLLRVRYYGVECALDIEAEAGPRPDMGRRLFEYGSRRGRATSLGCRLSPSSSGSSPMARRPHHRIRSGPATCRWCPGTSSASRSIACPRKR